MWLSKNNFNPEGKTGLIIGASQGIGVDIAQRLYEKNCSVILVARTESKLKEQVDRIRELPTGDLLKTIGDSQKTTPDSHTATADHYTCDVSDYSKCAEMWRTLLQDRKTDPDFIFCCAGSSIPKLFGDLSGEELASGMNINYMSAVNTIHAGYKAVLLHNPDKKPSDFKQRTIVLFSSTVASFPFIGYGQYAPAKTALMSLATILRQELRCYNYRVSCVFPGNFQSEGYTEEQKTKPVITKKIEGASVAIPSMECCDVVLDHLAKGYDSIYTDFIGWILASSALGVNSRCWGFFQVIVSFFFLLIAPIAMIFINKDISDFFKEKEQKKDL